MNIEGKRHSAREKIDCDTGRMNSDTKGKETKMGILQLRKAEQ